MLQRSLLPRTKKLCLAEVILALVSLFLGLNGLVLAQQSGQKTFVSPEQASQALFDAAQSDDKATLMEIFGPAGSQIISSGDEVQDKNSRDQFVTRYQQMHRLEKEPDGTTTLYIGAENWPVPLPLVNKSGAWYFDTEAGKKEILFRRIGRNEFAVIEVCHALVDAERDYFSQMRDGKPQQYAQKFISDQGEHNGLYWKTSEGEPESPIGPLVAYATSEGYGKRRDEGPSPFHGYFYRILTGQGKGARGGVKNYLVNGEMIGGFAILAYPADYRSSGVMTFIVNQDGIIYQKDLGLQTAELAKAMKEYAPDKTWRKAE